MKKTAANQWDIRFHPWPGWPNNTPWCTRCTFKAADDYERLAEKLVEQMHLYAISVKTEPHQVGEGYNNLVRMAAYALRKVRRQGLTAALKEYEHKPKRKKRTPAQGEEK